MGTPLKNPPVYLVLAKVEFNPILTLDNHVPAIQDAFRKAGYTDYAPHQFMTFVLPESEADAPQAVPQTLHQFGNPERTHAFLLNNHGLVLQSSDYGHFEQFQRTFLQGLERVHQIVTLGFTDRIGLRYLDRVMPRSGESLDSYLQPRAQGLDAPAGASRQHAYMEALHHIGKAQLMSRVIIQPDGPLTLPADIQTFNMVLQERFCQYQGASATLDNDAFLNERKRYDAAFVGTQLQTLHDAISVAFHAVVTKDALDRWNQ